MIDDLISRAMLEKLAGAAAFRRGEAYYAAGAVGPFRVSENKVSARVDGTRTYRVELSDDDGELAPDCTCPQGADGYFCKHCVALGLAWLANHAAGKKSKAKPRKAKRRDPWRNIKAYLLSQPSEFLVETLLEVAQRDDRLFQSLLLKAERTAGGGNVAEAFRRAIDNATHVGDFIDWRDVGSFAGDIDQIVDSLKELLAPNTAATLVNLAEYAIERIEGAMEHVDDSNGEIGTIVDGLGEMHRKACTMAKSEPVALAERLFRLETTLPFGLCRFDATSYRIALGRKGLQRYRELAEGEWREIEPRTDDRRYNAHRAAITRVMEHLAEASGDMDERVAIKAKDLSSAYRYLDIAEILLKVRRSDEALNWAERGLQAFPNRPDSRLRDFLTAAYLKRKRHDEALQLTWVQFEERPSLETFKKLYNVARKIGIWPGQRKRALAWLDQVITKEAASTSRWKPKPSLPNTSLRVSIALWEKDLDAAWTAAHQGTCDRGLLIALAGELENSRPEDSISLYRRIVPAIVDETKNSAYDEGVRLVRKIGAQLKVMNRSREFGSYLAELRVQFKPKRNFIKLLDRVA